MLQGEVHGLFDIVQAAFGGVVVNHRQPLCLRGLVLQQVLVDQPCVAVGMLHGHDAFVHQRDADAPPVQVFRVERLKKGDGRFAARYGQYGVFFLCQNAAQVLRHAACQLGGGICRAGGLSELGHNDGSLNGQCESAGCFRINRQKQPAL